MGQVQRLTRGQAKPYASLPRIDTSHPLASGLLFYGYDIGNAVIDLVRGVQSTPDAAPPNYSTGMSKYGPGVLYPNGIANGGLSIPSTAAIRAVAPPFTWATGCTQTVASPANSFNRIWGRTANDGSPAPFENWCFQANISGSGSQVRAGWSVNSSTEGDSATWNSLVANQFTSLLAQFTTSTNVDFYAQGVKQNSTTTSYSSTNTNDNIRYGSPGPATGLGQSFPGFVFYGAFWNRKLSPAEILLLHQDPYCFLIYPEDEMFATLVGVSGSTAYTLAGAEGAFVIGGQAATTAAARKLAGAEGAFTISGQAAAMAHGYKMAGAEGSFTISGQASAAVKALHLGGTEGAFVIGGQAATLTLTTHGNFTLAGAEGSFAISGQAAALNRAAKIAGAEGSFSISGQVAGMLRGIKLGGAEGAFVISGQAAAELRGIKMAGAEGAFVISGQAGSLSHGTKLAGVEGAFVISGQSAQFPVALSMKGAEGAFVISGQGAVLTYTPAGGGPAPVHGNPFMATPGPMTTVQ